MTMKHVRDNGFWDEVERRGYSLRRFAPLCGYTFPTLSRMKRGLYPMTYRFALTVSAALGVSVDTFFVPDDLPSGSEDHPYDSKEDAA